jgi:hypothetical protein
MALKETFIFEVNGVQKATDEVNELGDAITGLNKDVENLGKTSENVAAQIDDVSSLERAESIKRVTEGLAGGITSVAASLRGLGIESEALNNLERRANEFVAAVDGAVRVVAIFDKNNLKAFKSAIDGFKKSGIAAKLFGNTTRTAIAATGIGLLVIALGTVIANFDKLKEVAANNLGAIRKFIFLLFPPLVLVFDKVAEFSEKVGGLSQLFRGVSKAAKAFFTNVGEAFGALVKGDFGRLRDVIKDFGKDSAEAFNEGVNEVNTELAEKAADALVTSAIDANKRRLAELKAAGRDSFALQSQILRDELSLLENGSKEFLDKQSELTQLRLSNQKAAADKRKAAAEKEAAALLAIRESAEIEANEAAEAEIERAERNAAALFELEQLKLQNQVDIFNEFEELTIEQANDRDELEAEIAQNELNNLLENKALEIGEILLLEEQFNQQIFAIENARISQIDTIEQAQREKDKAQREQDDAAEAEAVALKLANRQDAAAAELEIQATLNAAALEGLDVIKKVFGEESKLGRAAIAAQKIFAIAQIGINLQQELAANAAAAAANPTNALTFGAAGVSQLIASNILSVVRAAAGVANVAVLRDGGVVRGRSHSAGGVRGTGRFNNIEVEGGEFVVNRKSTARFLPQLNRINQMQNGGQLPNFNNINDSIGVTQAQTGEIITALEGIAGREVVVSVEEINRVNDNLTRVKETATI